MTHSFPTRRSSDLVLTSPVESLQRRSRRAKIATGAQDNHTTRRPLITSGDRLVTSRDMPRASVEALCEPIHRRHIANEIRAHGLETKWPLDRKSTRLNSSH